jgi:hypothetical protein
MSEDDAYRRLDLGPDHLSDAEPQLDQVLAIDFSHDSNHTDLPDDMRPLEDQRPPLADLDRVDMNVPEGGEEEGGEEAGGDVVEEPCEGDPSICMTGEECRLCGSCGLQECSLWYSPSNARVAGGSLPDFEDIFDRPELWSRGRRMTKVLYLRASTLRQWSDGDFIERKLVPRLQEWGMLLALDVAGATWASCWADRNSRLIPDVTLIDRIITAGGRVDYIALQSVLSKPLPDPLPPHMAAHCPPYTMNDRYQDVIWYIGEINARYPEAQVGLIDALVAHGDDAISIFGALNQALQVASLSVDFVHFDHPFHHGESDGDRSWSALARAESYARETLGWSTGVNYVSSTGASQSERQYYEDVLMSRTGFIAAGGRPDWNMVNSWYVVPTRELPEDAEDTYPMTKILRDLGGDIRRDNVPPRGRAGPINGEGHATGWAIDADNPSQSVRVSAYVDGPIDVGAPLGEWVADSVREDVNEALNISGDHGYQILIDPIYADQQAHSLYVYVHDSRNLSEVVELAGSPVEFTLSPMERK